MEGGATGENSTMPRLVSAWGESWVLGAGVPSPPSAPTPGRSLLPVPSPLTARYSTVYVFKYYNMRNESFKQLREDLKESSRCAAFNSTTTVRTHLPEMLVSPYTRTGQLATQ